MDYMESIRVEMQDFIDNTANRVPICIVVDTSFSMYIDNRIGHVNTGIASMTILYHLPLMGRRLLEKQ